MFGNLRSLIGLSGAQQRGAERRTGEQLLEESDYQGAELHLAQAMVESERRQEPAAQRILLRLELAEAQRKQYRGDQDFRKLAEAEETVRSALELASRAQERELLIQVLDELAEIAGERGQADEVERLLQEAGALEATLKRRDPMVAARRLQRVGLLKQQRGELREAAQLLAESAAIHEQTLGESHAATAHRLSELGAVHHALGNHAEAQRCLRRAIRIHEKELGLESPEAAADLQMLTASYEASGDIDDAASQLERVLALKLRVVGMDLDKVAETQWELATCYMGWRRYSRARELLMEAVGTFKRSGGARLAKGYEALGQLEEDTGHYHEALRELARAAKVWESVKSEHVEDLIRNLKHRVFLFDLLRQHKEAAFLQGELSALLQASRWAEAGDSAKSVGRKAG
jgi:tetratricopeptide (TPR) repeat protein